MSKQITIKKEVDVEVELQIDYVECRDCGESLDFDVSSDSHGDLQIRVSKCACE